MTEAKGVEAVERALQILDCFDRDEIDLTLATIAKRTGQYKSTILRLAISLEKFGYLIREETGRFRLGPTTWRLGSNYRRGFDLAGIIRPELKLLSEATNETASYYVREGSRRVCLYRSEPDRAIRHSIVEGSSVSVDRGASGKIILAFSGNSNEGEDAIRTAGYAISLGERDADVAAISVPIFSAAGRLAGALSLSGLITRFEPARHPELIAALLNCQKRLSGEIVA